MSKGMKTPPEGVYKVLASYAVTGSFAQTAKDIGMPLTTIRKIVNKNKDEPEFLEMCKETKKDFAEKATAIIDKGLELLDRRISTALQHELELDILIDEIFCADKEKISDKEKTIIINKIKQLELQKLGEITTAIGTLYDKRALAKGESTENTKVTVLLPEGLNEYAE